MRVVQFCESFSPASETFIYDAVGELERQGAECHVLTINHLNQEERPFERVHVAPRPGRWNVPRLWHRALAMLGIAGDIATHKIPVLRARLQRRLRKIRPDVIHAQFGPMGVLIAPVAEALGLPLVVSFYGYDVSRLLQQNDITDQYRSLFEHADVLIGISNHICGKLDMLGASAQKTQLWHLGVDLSRFTYSNPANRYDSGLIRLLHVGRLTEKKSPLDLIETFHRAYTMLKGEQELHLTIAGDGDLREPMLRRIEALELSEQVSPIGAVPHAEVQRLMRESHLYTQHCKTASDGDEEGQGVTFVEASATGLPVVSTRHNGIPDVVLNGETGYLVPEGDTRAMGERIAHLAQHPEQWGPMGRAGRQHVEEHFDLSKQVEKLLHLYGDLRAHHASAKA